MRVIYWGVQLADNGIDNLTLSSVKLVSEEFSMAGCEEAIDKARFAVPLVTEYVDPPVYFDGEGGQEEGSSLAGTASTVVAAGRFKKTLQRQGTVANIGREVFKRTLERQGTVANLGLEGDDV